VIRAAIVSLLLAAAPLAAQEPATPPDGNPEMAEIFAADQADREGEIDWTEVSRRDGARRQRTRELLDAGALFSAEDYYGAAFVFQHGGEPEDYLLAHALAVRAAALGHPKAEWIAAATLDRYLQSIARDQIYGTQYKMSPTAPASQGRYDRELLSDALRSASGVEPLSEQAAKLELMEKRRLERWPEAAE